MDGYGEDVGVGVMKTGYADGGGVGVMRMVCGCDENGVWVVRVCVCDESVGVAVVKAAGWPGCGEGSGEGMMRVVVLTVELWVAMRR